MRRQAWLLLTAMSVLWGIPYLFIKVALVDLPPAAIAFGRVAVAVAVLLPIAVRAKALAPLRGRWGAVTALAVVHVVAPQLLITYGELHVSSGLTALLLAVQPLAIAALALRIDPAERTDRRKLIGLLAGLVGVAAAVGFDLGGGTGSQLVGAGLVLLAGISYALATTLVKKRLADVPSLGVVTGTTGIAAALLAPLAVLTAPARLPGTSAIGAVLVLGLLSTAAAFLLYYRLIALAGSGVAGLVSYTSPAVAVLLGAVLLGEPMHASTLAGFALILGGSWLATRPAAPRPAPLRTAAAS
ncbi:membrane protein [Catellatospora sp. TT07R-123]|uniref:DMT family transporter n=1 Tax=Catellatospora sp. TT07R-123 TaxID=2733863 RepID=UPI001B109444|nr:DMT family transporter [Catellatospora sp. TT07R-123]GHJ48636.1 membrane protein [Catellatospora sp. TT07R-123]